VRILAASFSEENLALARSLVKPNVIVEHVCVEDVIAPYREALHVRLRDYYSESIYYRLFIPQLFEELDKAVYLDSDVVLTDDVAKLYDTELGDNILGGVTDESVTAVPVFCEYVEKYVGVNSHNDYINSGVLVMNLRAMREERVRRKFLHLLLKYNFDTVAPDQDYLNFLCRGRIKYIDRGWNKHALVGRDIPICEVSLIHYNMFNKPWHYDGVPYEEEFWRVARSTPLIDFLIEHKATYTDDDRKKDMDGGKRLLEPAKEIYESNDSIW
jgi:lipopolysaccharide biosynthesis glycosyltransferase